MIKLKSADEIKIMDEANKIVHAVLDHLEGIVGIGVSSRDLDNAAIKKLKEFNGAVPAFKGYRGYPDVICASTNECVVHGIPNNNKLCDGDIISIDFGVHYNGFAGDAARTFLIGDVSDEVVSLANRTKEGLVSGIKQMWPGNRLYDINKAIDDVACKYKYGNVKDYSGHGIGTNMHERPSVFNYVNLNEPNVRLCEGMVFALEPMFCLGSGDTEVLEDKWTVVTKDRKKSAHWEVSVAITEEGPMILGDVAYLL